MFRNSQLGAESFCAPEHWLVNEWLDKHYDIFIEIRKFVQSDKNYYMESCDFMDMNNNKFESSYEAFESALTKILIKLTK